MIVHEETKLQAGCETKKPVIRAFDLSTYGILSNPMKVDAKKPMAAASLHVVPVSGQPAWRCVLR